MRLIYLYLLNMSMFKKAQVPAFCIKTHISLMQPLPRSQYYVQDLELSTSDRMAKAMHESLGQTVADEALLIRSELVKVKQQVMLKKLEADEPALMTVDEEAQMDAFLLEASTLAGLS